MYRCGLSPALLLTALTLVGCGVDLDVAPGTEITCADDGDCPRDYTCNTDIERCVSTTDAGPLEVTSLAPSTSFRVVVVFNKPLPDMAAQDLDLYRITPGLGITSIELIDANHTLILHTTKQVARPYELRFIGLTDAFGYGLSEDDTVKPFTGHGDPVDPVPPQPTAPTDRAVLSGVQVELRWAERRDAQAYYVLVALDAALQRLHPLTPPEGYFTASEPMLPLAVEGGHAYFWKVTSDISESYSAVSRFALPGTAVHVYCPPTEECAVGPTDEHWEAGTQELPFWSISRGAATADALGAATLDIAGRGGGAVYEDTLALTSGRYDVIGGWDPTFTTRDPTLYPTTLRGGARAMQAVSVVDTLVIEGLTVQAESGGTALLLAGCSRNVLVRDCVLEVTDAAGQALVIDSASEDDSGPVVEDSRAEGPVVVRGSGAAILRRNRFHAQGGPALTFVGQGGGILENSAIVGTGIVVTPDAYGCPNLVIQKNAVSTVGSPALSVRHCTIGSITVSNNLMWSGGVNAGDDILVATVDVESEVTDPIVNLAHNTIAAGLTTALATPVRIRGVQVMATNNLLACLEAAAGVGAHLSGSLDDFHSFQGNAAVGCVSTLRVLNANYDDDQTEARDDNSLNDGVVYRGNHKSLLAPTDLFQDADGADDNPSTIVASDGSIDNRWDLRLDGAAGPLRTNQLLIVEGGRDTSLASCGLHGEVPCGDIRDDYASATRTVSVSIGAYERER